MKRFCISITLFFISAILLIVGAEVFLPSRSAMRSPLGMYPVKLKRLAELPGRRIIFLGGSNLSHGLDSPTIEAELGMKVVNMGLHAGLGLRYIMWSTIDNIHKGDIVVIVPEYSQFRDAFYGKDVLMPMVFDIIPEHKRIMSFKQWQSIFEFFPRCGASKLFRFYICFTGSCEPPIDEFNAQGDLITPPSHDHPLPGNNGAGRMLMADEWFPETIPQIKEFVNYCQSIGAIVVFVPPAIMKESFAGHILLANAIAKALEENGMPFIVPPETMVFEHDLFYDTLYHLNIRGKPIRTRRMIDALRLTGEFPKVPNSNVSCDNL